jgi:hypothetical protein
MEWSGLSDDWSFFSVDPFLRKERQLLGSLWTIRLYVGYCSPG